MHAGESFPTANELEQVGFLRIAYRQFAAGKEQNGIEGGGEDALSKETSSVATISNWPVRCARS